MLKSENVGEKPPKANWILAVIGAVLLAGAYYLAVAVIDPASALFMFFIAVIMVIIATYLLFIAGSVAMCKLLQKNKKYYYKTKHFVSLSSMVYRMKRNGAGLASICILSTMVLVTLSSTMCLYAQSEDSIQNRYPHDISMDLTSSDYSETEPYREITAEVLDEYGEKAEDVEQFHMYSVAGFQLRDNLRLSMGGLAETGTGEVESIRSVYMICLDDYNRITGEHRALDEDELFLYPYKTGYDYDTITIGDCGTWQVDLMDEQPFPVGTAQANMMGAFFIVVKDISVVQRIEEYRNTLAEQDESGVTLHAAQEGFVLVQAVAHVGHATEDGEAALQLVDGLVHADTIPGTLGVQGAVGGDGVQAAVEGLIGDGVVDAVHHVLGHLNFGLLQFRILHHHGAGIVHDEVEAFDFLGAVHRSSSGRHRVAEDKYSCKEQETQSFHGTKPPVK